MNIKEILKDYQPKVQKGKALNKNQRLCLEIIEWFNIPKKYQGFWWKMSKKFPAFIEDRFIEIKRLGIKNTKYFKKMIFKQ